jgi:hypothetical protein
MTLVMGQGYKERIIPELRLLETRKDRDEVWKVCHRGFMKTPRVWVAIIAPWVPLACTLGLAKHLVRQFFPGWPLGRAPWLFSIMPSSAYMGLALGLGSLLLRGDRLRRIAIARQELNRRGIPVCLECGYDLRGLVGPRCPECGQPAEHRPNEPEGE